MFNELYLSRKTRAFTFMKYLAGEVSLTVFKIYQYSYPNWIIAAYCKDFRSLTKDRDNFSKILISIAFY